MSENNNQKEFVDGVWIRERKFNDGGSLLNVSILVSKFAEFVKKHKKKDGFINIVVAAKRQPDEKSTHYAYLDTWVPNGKNTAKSSKTEDNTDF